MNTETRKLLERCKLALQIGIEANKQLKTGKQVQSGENILADATYMARALEEIYAALAQPAPPEPLTESPEITWEEFARVAYDGCAAFRRDRLISDNKIEESALLVCEFYELSTERREAWTHGCAVALAAYKKLAQPAPAEWITLLKESHQVAMAHTVKARIPESGIFADIAQNLDHLVGLMSTAKTAQPAPLTEERIEQIFQSAADSDEGVHLRFARFIEAAHGIGVTK
jgi:hypothetical protein